MHCCPVLKAKLASELPAVRLAPEPQSLTHEMGTMAPPYISGLEAQGKLVRARGQMQQTPIETNAKESLLPVWAAAGKAAAPTLPLSDPKTVDSGWTRQVQEASLLTPLPKFLGRDGDPPASARG